MNKILILLGLFAVTALSTWEDHPDNDEQRRDASRDSQFYVVGSSYRDRDSKDDDHFHSRDENVGTINGPNDSKD